MKLAPTLAFLLLVLPLSRVIAHDHIAAGINGSSQLTLIGTTITGTTNTATYHMVPRSVGQNYGGYYSLDEFPRTQFPNDYFTFIALSDGQTQDDGPNHAPTGSYLWMEIASVSGPAGAHFGFWESGASSFQTVPTQSFLTGASTGAYKFELSEPLLGEPAASQDPYGHIHNRGWTVDQPGTYTVGFRVRDMSGLGPGGGPIVANSAVFTFTFVAAPEPGSAALLGAGGVLLAARRRRRL